MKRKQVWNDEQNVMRIINNMIKKKKKIRFITDSTFGASQQTNIYYEE